ncbi:hypothetical protein E4U41_003427 [Claviceps citrina]|nr:hypothetical protein E4U41_003427 [Claviceps citrina]
MCASSKRRTEALAYLSSWPSNFAVPISVGVGDIGNKSLETENALEPAQLIVDAI